MSLPSQSGDLALDLGPDPYSEARPPEGTEVSRCEFCGRFYSERTAKSHAYCIQAYDRRCAEEAGSLDV